MNGSHKGRFLRERCCASLHHFRVKHKKEFSSFDVTMSYKLNQSIRVSRKVECFYSQILQIIDIECWNDIFFILH